MSRYCTLVVVVKDGFPDDALNGIEYRDVSLLAAATETSNGLAALCASSSRRPWPSCRRREQRIARERNLCCVGSWFPGHTQRRLASVVVESSEKNLALPTRNQVGAASVRDSTAERFSATRQRSRIDRFWGDRLKAACLLQELTEGPARHALPIAPHRVAVRTLLLSSAFFYCDALVSALSRSCFNHPHQANP